MIKIAEPKISTKKVKFEPKKNNPIYYSIGLIGWGFFGRFGENISFT